MKWLEEIENRNNSRLSDEEWYLDNWNIQTSPIDIAHLISIIKFLKEELKEIELAHLNGDDYVIPAVVSTALEKLEKGKFK